MFISREDEAILHGLNEGKLSIFWKRGNFIMFISREDEAILHGLNEGEIIYFLEKG